jgi:protein-tyrosine phosphatase
MQKLGHLAAWSEQAETARTSSVVMPPRLRYPRSRMVDIHCHILPGLDDGPESLDVSLEMAEMAVAEGITHVMATPHANSQYPYIPELIQSRRDEIQARLGNRLLFATGCDFHLSYENLQDLHEKPAKYTLNQKNYLLVEFADYALPPSVDQTLHHLQLAGLQPIITHPERNPLIRAQPDRLLRWLHQGCYAQVTAQSFLGRFGPNAKHAAENWLDQRAVHFVASDAHNVTTRPMKLKDAFEKIAERSGEDVAQGLFTANPLAAFEGRPLPYVPEPAEPRDSTQPPRLPRTRKRFWFF